MDIAVLDELKNIISEYINIILFTEINNSKHNG